MRINKQLCMMFSTEEDYNKAVKAINVFEEIAYKIDLYKEEYQSYDDQLKEVFNNSRFDQKIYDKLEGEEKRNISRLVSLRDRTYVRIIVLQDLLK